MKIFIKFEICFIGEDKPHYHSTTFDKITSKSDLEARLDNLVKILAEKKQKHLSYVTYKYETI